MSFGPPGSWPPNCVYEFIKQKKRGISEKTITVESMEMAVLIDEECGNIILTSA